MRGVAETLEAMRGAHTRWEDWDHTDLILEAAQAEARLVTLQEVHVAIKGREATLGHDFIGCFVDAASHATCAIDEHEEAESQRNRADEAERLLAEAESEKATAVREAWEAAIEIAKSKWVHCLCGHFDHCTHGEEASRIIAALRAAAPKATP